MLFNSSPFVNRLVISSSFIIKDDTLVGPLAVVTLLQIYLKPFEFIACKQQAAQAKRIARGNRRAGNRFFVATARHSSGSRREALAEVLLRCVFVRISGRRTRGRSYSSMLKYLQKLLHQ
jgi:hypothetical protein